MPAFNLGMVTATKTSNTSCTACDNCYGAAKLCVQVINKNSQVFYTVTSLQVPSNDGY